MRRISIKGVLLGGVVDITSSVVLGIPFAIYASFHAVLAHTPKDQVGPAISALVNSPPIYLGELVTGLACSVLGGYIAGRIAKHDELLNGALSSILCLALGAFTLLSGKDSHSLAVQILLFLASPTFGLLGGYLSLLRRRAMLVAQT
jgi:putative membrane protein (TIGR04086 family)